MQTNPGLSWSFLGAAMLGASDAFAEYNSFMQAVCLTFTAVTLVIGLWKTITHRLDRDN